ncbi:MAG: PEP-CTERM sorting domain-containing protein [Acidobacteriia bacterium]|nr:PEP-CTERM sorting domain-containing protein [Terriglobia bacterium]
MSARKTFVGLALFLGGILQANASTIDLNSGSVFETVAGGEGTGRGIGFFADSTFSIDFAAIQADLISQSFDVVIYSSTDGHEAGAVLTSASAVLGGTGFGFNAIPINFTFNAGSFYVLNWRPTSGGGNDTWVGPGGSIYYNDSALPVTVGPVTLIDGTAGFNADDFSNVVHPNLQVDLVSGTVPEPSTFGLMLGGIALIALCRRRLS